MKIHYFHIKVIDAPRFSVVLEQIRWDDLRYELLQKYFWYFEYRAALLKVKYPKSKVETKWGYYDASGRFEIQLAKNRVRARKAKITEKLNKLEKAKAAWDSIFPIEDDPLYQKAIIAIEASKERLSEAEKELKKIQNENRN